MTTSEFLDRLVEETDMSVWREKHIPKEYRSETRFEKEARERIEREKSKEMTEWKITTFFLGIFGSIALFFIKSQFPNLLPGWLYTILDIII